MGLVTMTTSFTIEERELEIRRLLYNSWHRGCKETDLLLGKFARVHLAGMNDNEIRSYATFLDEDDWDIFNWLTGNIPLPERHNNTAIQALLNFHFADE